MGTDPWKSAANAPKPAVDSWGATPNTASQAYSETALQVSRIASQQLARMTGDLNQTVPPPERDPKTGGYYFSFIPIPLPRLFGSPLSQNKPKDPGVTNYATGPGTPPERLVISGWADPRPSEYGQNVKNDTIHKAVDFAARYGEPVYAAGPGKVSFVGIQRANPDGPWAIPGATAVEATKQIANGQGQIVVANTNDIGFGGICVFIEHGAPFEGYQTEYMHLSKAVVASGNRINEGDLIGYVGGTGGKGHWMTGGYHLHFQVVYKAGSIRALVPPSALVPNYWPGHIDSTNSNSGLVSLIIPFAAATGSKVIQQRALKTVNAYNRATGFTARTYSQTKQDHADYAGKTAQVLDVQQTAVYTAEAAFKGDAPVITNPMGFDFSRGVWVIGDQDDGVV